MRYIILSFSALLLLLSLILFLQGRQGHPLPNHLSKIEKWITPNNRVKVVSTTAIIDSIVEQIGGERIDHISLIEESMDPHSYELVKGDSEKLSFAQIIFCNGLNLEHGASLRYQLQHHPNTFALGDIIQKKIPEKILFNQNQPDPHIWLDASLWAEVVDPIVQALIMADPEGKSYYETQGEKVKNSIVNLDKTIRDQLKMIPSEKKHLVTSHSAFNYFTRRYLTETLDEAINDQWQSRCSSPEGLAPDGQLSCFDIQCVVNYIFQYKVKTIFPESNVSQDSLRKIQSICLEKGFLIEISKNMLHSDTLGSFSQTYQEMLANNANILYQTWIS
jgi:manganese/zinc/iron transport system substrate-binding protein